MSLKGITPSLLVGSFWVVQHVCLASVYQLSWLFSRFSELLGMSGMRSGTVEASLLHCCGDGELIMGECYQDLKLCPMSSA